jgi:hypothetical protein
MTETERDLVDALEAIINSSLGNQVMPGHFDKEWKAAISAIANARDCDDESDGSFYSEYANRN